METLELVADNPQLCAVVNVASVPHRSPFRYPGGKTWLVPRIRQWLRSRGGPEFELIEPFAGGAIVSLTAVFEGLVRQATLVELDADVASVWHTILNGGGRWLADRIAGYDLSRETVRDYLSRPHHDRLERAFATILRNRISRGGIMAPGAGIVKSGENGRGLASRWYPETLRRRILDIVGIRHKLRFIEGDGVAVMRANAGRPDALYFIDPPYVVAGRRLYTHSSVDHHELFSLTAELRGDFMMTYDSTPEITDLAAQHGLEVRHVPMKNTHHQRKCEIIIGRCLDWMN